MISPFCKDENTVSAGQILRDGVFMD